MARRADEGRMVEHRSAPDHLHPARVRLVRRDTLRRAGHPSHDPPPDLDGRDMDIRRRHLHLCRDAEGSELALRRALPAGGGNGREAGALLAAMFLSAPLTFWVVFVMFEDALVTLFITAAVVMLMLTWRAPGQKEMALVALAVSAAIA